MNIPDPALYLTVGTGFSVWCVRAFIKQGIDSDRRQRVKEQLEAKLLQDADNSDRITYPETPEFLSVKDWRLVIAEVKVVVDGSINQLRSELAVDRSEDRDQLREWINGSFLRGPVVEAKLETFEAKLSTLQSRVDHFEQQNSRPH